MSSIVWPELITVLRTHIYMYLGISIGKVGRLLGIFSLRKVPVQETKVIIEAGSNGWKAVFFEELRESLCEYLTPEAVVCSSIDREKSYLYQALSKLNSERPTHYCFDPRTGPQKSFRTLMNSCILIFFLGLWRITPIVILTDASIRLWRYQAFLLTGSSGLVITFLDAQSMGALFPHKRVIGPSFIPISRKTCESLKLYNKSATQSDIDFTEVYFLGSLYSERKNFLSNLESELRAIDSKVRLNIEEKSSDISSIDYWKKITSHKCVVTTTFQYYSDKYPTDRINIDQMVFRISETLAAGKLLFCTSVPGMSKYFLEDQHFVSYRTSSEAASKMHYYSEHPSEAHKIALKGQNKYQELATESTFWVDIDKMLISKNTRPLLFQSNA